MFYFSTVRCFTSLVWRSNHVNIDCQLFMLVCCFERLRGKNAKLCYLSLIPFNMKSLFQRLDINYYSSFTNDICDMHCFFFAHLCICMVGSCASLSFCLSICNWTEIHWAKIHEYLRGDPKSNGFWNVNYFLVNFGPVTDRQKVMHMSPPYISTGVLQMDSFN